MSWRCFCWGDAAITTQLDRLTAEELLQIRYHYVEFLTEHLADCSRVFNGDLQEMLVLAVMGQVHVRDLLYSTADGTGKAGKGAAPLCMSASRIADITGISRQTVRRKLAKLQARGWVEAKPASLWAVALRADVAAAREGVDGLGALDARSMERAVRLGTRMGKIITRT